MSGIEANMDYYISGHEGSNEGAHLGGKAKVVPTPKLSITFHPNFQETGF